MAQHTTPVVLTFVRHGHETSQIRVGGKFARMDVRERLMRHVDTSGECWLWTGSKDRDGYGKFTYAKGVYRRPHRVLYELDVGPIPPGSLLLHSCDVRACVRPAHLRPGTQKENIRDMDARGRRTSAVFSEDIVREIRRRAADGAGGTEIARALGLNRASVYGIIHGRSWRGVA